ncbi:MAG: hypothetical protein OHK93_006180 [Ramalina farinacea]|uniref:Uncharacterized protein n=1 Tax=Ramalina farinacea TaxID=258253 RepID=A0AA43TSS6_9LECA|nr:hypothetical protein [Ramalina farinacea]
MLLAQRRSLPNIQQPTSPTVLDEVEKKQRKLSQKLSSAKAQRPIDTYQESTATQQSTPSVPHERLTDAQSPSVDDVDTYRLMVLRSNETEEELDRRLDQTASALGLRSPQDMNATLDLITQDASALDLDPYSPEDALPPPRTHSRTSRAANTPSASSVESKESKTHRKTPSLAATSTATSSSSAPSAISDISLKSNYVRFKDSMKRMSTIGTKRKALSLQPSMTDLSQPPVPSIPPNLPRSNTADQIMRISDPQVVVVRNSGPNVQGPPWQEQVRFITFRASQTRLLRKTHTITKDAARARFRAAQAALERAHAAHLARLEESHLSAELDLERALQGDRQACDARIRHMQAYISGDPPPPTGMPRRRVTAADREKLELEQEQQLDRVGNKHEGEMAGLLREYRGEKQVLRRQREEEEQAMEGVFAERKRRMVARWGVAEAIERRKLEIETGEEFAPLPVVGWGDFEGRDAAEEEERYVKKVMGRGGFKVDEETGWMVAASDGVGEKGGGEDVTAGAGVGEYDAENMI